MFNSIPVDNTFLRLSEEDRKALKERDAVEVFGKTIEIGCTTHGVYKAEFVCVYGDFVKYSQCPICAAERQDKEMEIKRQAEAREREASFNNMIETLQKRGVDNRYIKRVLIEGRPLDPAKGAMNCVQKVFSDQMILNGTENIILVGNCGVGKSFVGYHMVHRGYMMGINIKAIKLYKLVSLYKYQPITSTFGRTNSPENIEDFLKGTHTLIVDDIDDGFNDDGRVVIKCLIDICYNAGVRLVFIGNCSADSFKQQLEYKSYSRLRNNTKRIELADGLPDLRCEK